MNSSSVVYDIELKRLLVELKEKRQDICIRFRLLGEMWLKNFVTIAEITEKGLIFYDKTVDKKYTINDLTMIIQFEIDAPFQNYKPYLHYEVKLSHNL